MKMNELKIWCEDGALMYFKTKKETAKEAYYEFLDLCDRIQLNIDNLRVCELVLQNEEFVEFDWYKL